LRYLGFCPKDVGNAPRPVITFVAEQLGTAPLDLAEYGQRSQTRSDHGVLAQSHLGFRCPKDEEIDDLGSWLVARALEHDRPMLLLELACERLVVSARQEARRETYRLLQPLLAGDRKTALDSLLVSDEETGRTPLAWLRQDATSSKPRSILETIDKLRHLREMRVGEIELDRLNPSALARNDPRVLSRSDPAVGGRGGCAGDVR
jgi:hypothetical protein